MGLIEISNGDRLMNGPPSLRNGEYGLRSMAMRASSTRESDIELTENLTQMECRGGAAGPRLGSPIRGLGAEEEMPVLPVQRRPASLRDHVANGATQELLAETEHALGGGRDPGGHRLLDDGQQRGRGFTE